MSAGVEITRAGNTSGHVFDSHDIENTVSAIGYTRARIDALCSPISASVDECIAALERYKTQAVHDAIQGKQDLQIEQWATTIADIRQTLAASGLRLDGASEKVIMLVQRLAEQSVQQAHTVSALHDTIAQHKESANKEKSTVLCALYESNARLAAATASQRETNSSTARAHSDAKSVLRREVQVLQDCVRTFIEGEKSSFQQSISRLTAQLSQSEQANSSIQQELKQARERHEMCVGAVQHR
jgi:hypothetical protein